MRAAIHGICWLLACLLVVVASGCSHSQAKTISSWNPEAAAAYLDQREDWWMGWQGAARDRGTFCVSCHTALPYAFSRPALDHVLHKEAPAAGERRLVDDVIARVRQWKQIGPYYDNRGKGGSEAVRSRGTEAVLNALILANDDAGQGRISEDTRAAFENMWALQMTSGDEKGAWSWLQFGMEPWEARDSQYYGAALAALAVGTAPENYRASPEIQDNLKLLDDYLNREYPTQSLSNRMVLLWASTKLPGLLEAARRASLMDEIVSEQRRDGGWSMASLGQTWRGAGLRAYVRTWIRSDGTLADRNSDGLATGLAVFVLQQAGMPRDTPQLQRGLSWLLENQNATQGFWQATSPNLKRDPSSNIGRFMNDAATSFAVLALADAGQR